MTCSHITRVTLFPLRRMKRKWDKKESRRPVRSQLFGRRRNGNDSDEDAGAR